MNKFRSAQKKLFLSGCFSLIMFSLLPAQELAKKDHHPSPPVKNSFTGKITDAATGAPLVGASVYFADLKAGTVSNEKGFFIIRNLPAGKYLAEISYLGFQSVVERISLAGHTEMDFALVHAVVENEAVIVTGVSTATSIRKSPIPVNILKKQDLLTQSSTNLIDALSTTPGVSQIATGPAISKPTIRGLGYNRLVVINDGIRQEGQQWGDEHGIEIDEYSVNKVEVLKGPASIMYGSDALAGVVNIISNTPVPAGTINGNIFTNYQTNNGLTGLNGNVAGNINGFNWNAYGSYKSAYDYKNKYDGRVFNSAFKEKNFGGYIGLNKTWGYSHLLVSHFDQMPGLVEGDRDDATGRFLKPVNNGGTVEEEIATGADFTSRSLFIPYQRVRHFKISTDNSLTLGDGRLNVIAGYQRNQRQEFGNVLEPEEEELYFDLHTISYQVQYHFPGHNKWQTTIGIGGMQQTNLNKGEEALIPEYGLFDLGGFIYRKLTLDKLTLSGGLRFDNRSISSHQMMEDAGIKFEKFHRNFSNISGSAGLSYEVSKPVTLKLNVARGFRAPGMPELASNGAHEGTNRYEYGNRDLKSETSLQIDGGLDLQTEHVSFSLSLFNNRINNFIYYRKLSAVAGGDSLVNLDGEDHFAFIFSQHNANLYGAEFNLDIHPHPLDWLHIENTFSLVRGKLSQSQDGSKNLPFIPAARFVNHLRGDFLRKGKTLRNLYVLAELDNTFAQNHPFTGYNTETKTSGYSLLNLGAGSDFISRGKTLFSLYLAAKNVTDVAYQSHLSRLKYGPENLATGRTGVYNMGMNFSIKLTVPLVFKSDQ